MAGKKTRNHQRDVAFAALKALGVSNPDAYIATKAKGNGTRKNDTNEGWKLTQRPEIAQLIEDMKERCKDIAPITKEMIVEGLYLEALGAFQSADRIKAWRSLGDLEGLFIHRTKDETEKTDITALIARMGGYNPQLGTQLAKMYSDRSLDSNDNDGHNHKEPQVSH